MQCASSILIQHRHHKTAKGKKEFLKIELQELENSIYPKYQEIAFHIRGQKADINKNFKYFSKTLEKRREL